MSITFHADQWDSPIMSVKLGPKQYKPVQPMRQSNPDSKSGEGGEPSQSGSDLIPD